MDDDSSNDASTPTLADTPIIQFFKRLVMNNSSQNTMLTNAQIQEILIQEFNFDLTKLHELEVEIYINILKKFLKDWPVWDDFDRIVKDLTSKGDEKSLNRVLEEKYEGLKSFIQTNLDIAKPLAEESVAKMREKIQVHEKPELSKSDSVVLEVQATREQLNSLFLRYPNASSQNTIFNYTERVPSYITVSTLSLDSILHWWSVSITLSLQWLGSGASIFIKRETTHILEHELVNRKVPKPLSRLVLLNSNVQIKAPKKAKCVPLNQLTKSLNLLKEYSAKLTTAEEVGIILECLKKDLTFLLYRVTPADYRKYYSKFPYVRYLYADKSKEGKKQEKAKYDIQLKETLSPMFQLSIGKLDGCLDSMLPQNWLKVDCMSCNKSFTIEQLGMDLKQHFAEYHQNEPDWQCTNCLQTFPMAYLASQYWSHECELATE